MDWIQALWVIVQAYWVPVLLILFGFVIVVRALLTPRAFTPTWALPVQWRRDYQDQYNIGAIRNLLQNAFRADELKEFCQDRPAFRPILKRVSTKPSLADLAEALIEHSKTRILFDQLLADIHEVNPRHYELYRGQLYAGDITAKGGVPLSWRDIPSLSRLPRYGVMGAGGALVAIGLVWIVLTSVSLAPPTSLISLSYIAEDWDPRTIDLRTASSSGIPVSSGQSLQLFNLWVAVPEDAPDYEVKAEVYAGDQRIGSTTPIPLIADKDHPGTAKLGEVTVERFDHDTVHNAWRVQPDWTDLDVVLTTERSDKAVGSTRTKILLSASGEAWIIGPPDANFASMAYTVNDGPMLVMDMRDPGETGLGLKGGDRLTLLEIWYNANLDGGDGYRIKAEAFLSPDGYDRTTHQVSKPNVIQQGVHKLSDYTPFDWTIQDGQTSLVLTLTRSDRAVMDRLTVPLGGQRSSGLISPAGCPAASLISLSFKVQEYVDPRLVDLRTASTSGIPVQAGQALQLLDLWAWVPPGAPGDTIQVEVYANGQQIGYTPGADLVAGAVWLGDVTASSFQHGTYANGWEVQEDWADLMLFLVTYDQGRKLGIAATTIRLNPQGTAWLVGPPNLSFASIVYSINDGPPLVWDLRKARQAGLGARPGDTLTLREVWYRSNANSTEYKVMAEGYLLSATGASSQHADTTPIASQWGINRLPEISKLSWALSGDEEALVLALWRMGPDHNVVMDGLGLSLASQEASGLVPGPEAVVWPFEQVEYVDFELPPDVDEWIGSDASSVAQSSERAFSGYQALAVSTIRAGEMQFVVWQHPIQAEVVIGQVFWPHQERVRIVYAQACAWACVPIPIELDQWNTFVMDFSELTYKDTPLNTMKFSRMWIQGQIEGIDDGNPYTFYLDGIQLYPVR